MERQLGSLYKTAGICVCHVYVWGKIFIIRLLLDTMFSFFTINYLFHEKRTLTTLCVGAIMFQLGLKWFLELLDYKKSEANCASKNYSVHLLEMHWIFGSRKYMPHRTTQQCSVYSPSTVITAARDAPFYHSALLPLVFEHTSVTMNMTLSSHGFRFHRNINRKTKPKFQINHPSQWEKPKYIFLMCSKR